MSCPLPWYSRTAIGLPLRSAMRRSQRFELIARCAASVASVLYLLLPSTTVWALFLDTRRQRCDLRVNEYTAFCNGPGDVKSPRVMSRAELTLLSVVGAEAATLCCQKERSAYLDWRGWSDDGHWPCNGFTSSTVSATGLRAVGLFGPLASRIPP